MVPILAMLSRTPSPKAKLATNSAIVKPMPQSQLAPRMCLHETPAGGAARFALADRQAHSHIPKGFPTNRPSTTPRHAECLAAAETFPRMCTPALEKANNGITTKLTQG